MNVLPVSGESGTGVSREDYIAQVAQDIENKMPKVFDLDSIRKHLGLGISPTTVVLLQELERFNKLTIRMMKSLAELQRVSGVRWEGGRQGLGSRLEAPWLFSELPVLGFYQF